MPSGNAQRPGDVVTTMSGQTVEVINTDAEGRLVLCDAITWAQREYKPEVIVDLATLTGAMVISLGHEYAGVFSNDDKLAEQLTAAGRSEERRVGTKYVRRVALGGRRNIQKKRTSIIRQTQINTIKNNIQTGK